MIKVEKHEVNYLYFLLEKIKKCHTGNNYNNLLIVSDSLFLGLVKEI